MSGYLDFGNYYDKLITGVNYQQIADFLQDTHKANKVEGMIYLDAACGTGSLCEEMFKKGYDVVGVDTSESMLSVAIEKKHEKNLDILYLKQDIRKLDMYGTVDLVSCMMDSVNHLLTLEDVEEFFGKVSLFMHPRGVFVFDVNTEYKHGKILRGNTFVYDMEDVYCVWSNEEIDSKTIEISIDIFDQDQDARYQRYSDSFKERLYTHQEIERALSSKGMKIVKSYDGESFKEVLSDSQRVVYVAKKF